MLLALYPAVYLLFSGEQDGANGFNIRRMGLMENSLWIAGGCSVLCMVIAVFASVRLYGAFRRMPAMRWFFLLLAPVPSYVYALSYMNILRFLGRFFPAVLRFRMAGILPCILVESFAFLPYACAAALLGLERMDAKEWKAALLMQDADRVYFRIVFPRQLPYVLAMGAVIFVLSITDYSIPSLFQVNVYAMEIFSDYSAVGQSTHSLKLAFPLILISAVVILLALFPLRKEEGVVNGREKVFPVYSKGMRMGGSLAVTVLVLQILLPILSLLPYIPAMAGEFVSAGEELINSFMAGGLAVCILTGPAAAVAMMLSVGPGVKKAERNRKGNTVIGNQRSYRLRHLEGWFLAILPLAIPGTLTGIGLLQFLSRSPLHVLRNGNLMPALGMAARYLPLSMLIQYGCYVRLDREKIKAAKLLQRRRGAAFWRVQLPMMLPGLVISGIVVFLLTLGDVGTALVLMPAGREPLSVKIYNYLHYGASETVAIFCLMQTAVCMISMMMIYIAVHIRHA